MKKSAFKTTNTAQLCQIATVGSAREKRGTGRVHRRGAPGAGRGRASTSAKVANATQSTKRTGEKSMEVTQVMTAVSKWVSNCRKMALPKLRTTPKTTAAQAAGARICTDFAARSLVTVLSPTL